VNRKPLLKLLPLAALLVGVAHADIYRWKDAQGRVHYGDQPPATGAQKIEESPPPSPLSPEEANAQLEAIRAKRDAAAEDAAKAREEKAKEEAKRKQRAGECAALQRQLDSMRAAQRIQSADGHWYTGDERVQKERELENTIAKHCGGTGGR
jgi:hypothetical protein